MMQRQAIDRAATVSYKIIRVAKNEVITLYTLSKSGDQQKF